MTTIAEQQPARVPEPSSKNMPARRSMGQAAMLGVGLLAALAATSCCLVPFVLFSVGVSGAWIGNLTALDGYRPLFLGVAFAALAGGGYTMYRRQRRRTKACVEGSYCAQPRAHLTRRIVLWSAIAVFVIALGFPYVLSAIYES